MPDGVMTRVSGELALFAEARNWKRYLAGRLAPYVSGRVLEVGAGIGGNIPFLFNDRVTDWLALEPDPKRAALLQFMLEAECWHGGCHAHRGTIADLPDADRFEAILYIDVLEHIQDDTAELARASYHLSPGGHLIVVGPAHGFLFSPFDAAVGHFRRYGRATMRDLAPPDCRLVALQLLDTAGLLLSLGNRLALRSATPTRGQILLWDRWFVPVSRWLDRLTGFRFGKSILAVWTKPR